MLKITSKQADKVHRLVKKQCANCDENGNCILLDDGEATAVCSLSLSTVFTAIILRIWFYRATEICLKKLCGTTRK